ncbi:DnaD domain-containing protein [Caldibacillus lycopersici]|uniref:DnaD domain-containing protein n=1 Tax=Perspicuibacillus lycopersici TaxID=1325689 RepID=A0AAE3IX60_9BACI|nr:DnaD domain-containing protein [Perspicuibacillus lycopersici]MCU9613680.1 DnaD domain-containing protein [Perspicuibacillus lycopersici]
MKNNIILSWIEEGVVSIPSFLFSEYKSIGLTDLECMLILQLHAFMEKGNSFPTLEELSNRMTLSLEQCSQTLGSLLTRGYLEILKGHTDQGIYFEKYSLQPLWKKLINHQLLVEKEQTEQQLKLEEGSLFTIFEQEFARPLSPMECETLAMWIDNDHHNPALIKAALQESVMSGKLNFRYIDRILFEWKKNGIQTVDQAKQQGKKFRSHQQKTKVEERKKGGTDTVPFYNWLES